MIYLESDSFNHIPYTIVTAKNILLQLGASIFLFVAIISK